MAGLAPSVVAASSVLASLLLACQWISISHQLSCTSTPMAGLPRYLIYTDNIAYHRCKSLLSKTICMLPFWFHSYLCLRSYLRALWAEMLQDSLPASCRTTCLYSKNTAGLTTLEQSTRIHKFQLTLQENGLKETHTQQNLCLNHPHT